MNWRGARALAACGAWLLVPALAAAHSQPYSWLDLRLSGDSLHGTVTAHIVDLAHDVGEPSPPALLANEHLAERTPALERMLGDHLHLEADGERIPPHWLGARALPERMAVRFEFDAPRPHAAELAVTGPLFTWEDTHETYFNVYVGDSLEHQDVLDHGHTLSTWHTGLAQGTWAVARRFVAEGVHHIFIGPDHILFIVGLLLLGGSLGRLLKIVTAFTLAHSITLALATLSIVNPPARIIEPLIALSIVFVGIENLVRSPHRDRRAGIAFLFGFVHGFGFASVLRELSLPREALGAALLSFNVGVELGQMTIVLAVAPVLAWVRSHRPTLARPVLTWGSAAVIAAGSYWFVQRAFFGVS